MLEAVTPTEDNREKAGVVLEHLNFVPEVRQVEYNT